MAKKPFVVYTALGISILVLLVSSYLLFLTVETKIGAAAESGRAKKMIETMEIREADAYHSGYVAGYHTTRQIRVVR